MVNEMKEKKWDEVAIRELVRGLDSPDWVQIELLARLAPEERVLVGLGAAEFARAALRGTLQERFPQLTAEEVNMKILAHFTSIRMPKA